MAEIEHNDLPGSYLAKRRSDRGLTQEEVAKKLHLSPSVIKKLELNEFDDQLPDAFARGYLRNYAKLLDIEPQEIIAAYTLQIGANKVKNYYQPDTTSTSQKPGLSINQIAIMALLAAPVMALLIWFLGRDAEPASDNSQLDTTTINQDKSLPDTMTDTPSDIPFESRLSEAEVTSPDALPAADSDPLTVASETDALPTGFIDTAEALLEFDFNDDCWVQVMDANGEVLAVGLKTTGRRFQVSGIAPIRVVLGKPRAVNITYNSTAVDLACFPAGSTARFTLDSPLVCEN